MKQQGKRREEVNGHDTRGLSGDPPSCREGSAALCVGCGTSKLQSCVVLAAALQSLPEPVAYPANRLDEANYAYLFLN